MVYTWSICQIRELNFLDSNAYQEIMASANELAVFESMKQYVNPGAILTG